MIDGRRIEWVLLEANRARCRLSLEEVVMSGLPAVYQEFGERLLYVDGTIVDACDPGSPAEIPLGAPDESSHTVGIEFGWRHTGDCQCQFCAGQAAREAT